MDKQQEFVLRTLEERDIRFVRLWFTDVLGTLKSVAIAPAELEGAFAEGIGFDGSAIEGFTRVQESDMLAKPDPATFQVLPWRGRDGPGTARMFCDITMPDGTPSWADPRHVLRRALGKAADAGFTFYTHPEIEFFLLKGLPADRRACRCRSTPPATSTSRRTASARTSAARPSRCSSGWASRWSSATTRSRPASRRSTCATPTRCRRPTTSSRPGTSSRRSRSSQGVYATFMPKPFSDQPGSGMHTHLSLFEGDTNAFYDAADPLHLSKVAKHFIAGLLTHAAEITAVTNQWVNSYKRLVVGRRGAAVRLLGLEQPQRAGARADVQADQGRLDPHRGAQPGQRDQPLPRASRCCSPPG